jgi:hypothetical protein
VSLAVASRGRDSAVGIATGYELHGQGIENVKFCIKINKKKMIMIVFIQWEKGIRIIEKCPRRISVIMK